MRRKANVIGRYIFVFCGLVAVGVLAFVITSNANEETEMLDINEKYTIQRIKENVNGVIIYYPLVKDMADKEVEEKINDNIKEIADLFRGMADGKMLLSVDYRSAYKGGNYLSFFFKGMMKIDGKEMELAKAITMDVDRGDVIEITDFITEEDFENRGFNNLIKNKLTSSGIDEDYDINKDTGFYLEKNNNEYKYVFFFLQNTDSKYYSEIRLTQEEVSNALKEDDDEKLKEELTNKENESSNVKDTQTDIITLDKNTEELISDKIIINGEEVILDENKRLYMYNNRIFVPLDYVASKLGYKIEVNENSEIVVSNDSRYVTLTVNEDRYYHGVEKPFKLGEKTTIKNDIVFVPIEFFSKVLNNEVNVKENVVYINTKE